MSFWSCHSIASEESSTEPAVVVPSSLVHNFDQYVKAVHLRWIMPMSGRRPFTRPGRPRTTLSLSLAPSHNLPECRKKPQDAISLTCGACRLFELLLGAELVGVSARALAAVGGTGREAGLCCVLGWAALLRMAGYCSGGTYVALAADLLVAVVLGGESLQRGLDDATTETEDQVEGGLLHWG
jgi:hypothetical protein